MRVSESNEIRNALFYSKHLIEKPPVFPFMRLQYLNAKHDSYCYKYAKVYFILKYTYICWISRCVKSVCYYLGRKKIIVYSLLLIFNGTSPSRQCYKFLAKCLFIIKIASLTLYSIMHYSTMLGKHFFQNKRNHYFVVIYVIFYVNT